MKTWAWPVLLCAAFIVLATAPACGGGDGEAAAPEVTATYDAVAVLPPAPTSTPSVAAAAMATEPSPPASDASEEPTGQAAGLSRVQQSFLAQDRVIVHTASMALAVANVAQAMEGITGVVTRLGGWVVSAERGTASHGSIAVRVPAASLNDALEQISRLSLREESRAISSKDVTEEFVDSHSRLASMRAAEQRILSFLDKAETVKDTLLVQKELEVLQERIEQTQGRINALSQTSAFSLIEISMRLTPMTIGVDVGPDLSARVGEPLRFKATFASTPGIEDYSFIWSFGDGTDRGGSATAPTPEGLRATGIISHEYASDAGSPYIVTVRMSGRGEGGIVQGTDSLLVEVKSVPSINLFAGGDRTVEEGVEADYSASFTRPEGLSEFEYQWDFGDGTPTVQGEPAEGSTRVTVPHTYEVYHPRPYTAVVTITAMSEAGPVTAAQSFRVTTTQAESFIVAGWDISGTTRSAVRALSVLAQAATVVVIWIVVFSPVVAIVAGVLYLVRRYRPERPSARPRRQTARSAAQLGNRTGAQGAREERTSPAEPASQSDPAAEATATSVDENAVPDETGQKQDTAQEPEERREP